MDFINNLLDPTIIEDDECPIGVLVMLQETLIHAQNYYTGLSKNSEMVLSFTDILHTLFIIDQNLMILDVAIESKRHFTFAEYSINHLDPDLLICLN